MTSATLTPSRPAGSALGDAAALVGRHLLHLRRSPGRFLGTALNPLVMLVVLGYLFAGFIVVPGTGSYPAYIIAGCLAQVRLASVGPTAVGVAADLRNGLVDRMRSLPVSDLNVLLGRVVSDWLIGLATIVLVALVGLVIGWRITTSPAEALAGFALLALFVLAMVWIGTLLGLAIRTPETIDGIGAMIVVAFSFLSSAFFSADGLPAWIRPVAAWNPVSSVVTACRMLWGNPVGAAATDLGGHQVLVATGTLLVMLAVVVPLCVRAFRRAGAR